MVTFFVTSVFVLGLVAIAIYSWQKLANKSQTIEQLEVRVVFRVKPEDAPFMVAKIGGIDRLVQNVMHPLIDSIFRNQASESSAMAYLQTGTRSRNAPKLACAHLLKYHVDVAASARCCCSISSVNAWRWNLMATRPRRIRAR